MLKRVILTGFGAGVVAAAALYYPLYVFLSGTIVLGWQAASAQVAAVLGALAALILGVGGGLAARWHGDSRGGQRVIVGALTGALGGFTAYGLIGATAAGVLASAAMFAPASDEAAFMTNLVNTIIQTFWLVHIAFWGAALIGALFGGVGALLAPLKPSGAAPETEADEPYIANIAAVTAMLASALALIVTIAVFALLPESLRRAAQGYGTRPLLPPESVTLWPTATLMALFLVSVAATAASVRSLARLPEASRSVLASAASSTVLAIFLPVVVLILGVLVSPAAILSPAFLPGIVASLALAASLIPLPRDLLRRARSAPIIEADRPASILRRNLLPVMLVSALGLTIPGYGTVLPTALNLVLNQIVQIGWFYNPETASGSSPTALVNSVYQTQAGMFGLIVVMTFAAPLIGIGLILLVDRLLPRDRAGAKEAK